MEIVLAIALTSVVMYLLMTAVELYMIRVDSSRGRVESAQLARTLLDQMAADLAAMRLDPPAAVGGGAGSGRQSGGQQAGGGGQSGGAPAGQGQQNAGGGFGAGGTSGTGGGAGASSGSSSGSAATPATLHGIFGTAEELRIDRAAPPNWARASRAVESTEPTSVIDLPRTVRYYVVDGTAQSSQEFAQRGVNVEETAANVSGLYRELIPTASLSEDADPLASPASRDGARVELLAPEVVKLELHYFDGEQLVDEWDVVEDAGLPAGIEILLTIHEPDYGPSDEADQPRSLSGPQYDEKDLVVYRRFVRIPKVTPPQPATALLPAGQQNGGGQPAQAGGQQSGGQSGQGGQNGQGGGGQNNQGGAQQGGGRGT